MVQTANALFNGASRSWQQVAILTQPVGFTASFLCYLSSALVGLVDGRDPRFVSVAQPLAMATWLFCWTAVCFVKVTKDGSTELDPRYGGTVSARAVSWGLSMFLGSLCSSYLSFELARATRLSAQAETLKAAQPKLALAMVYVVISVLLSITSDGSIAAPFGEAFA